MITCGDKKGAAPAATVRHKVPRSEKRIVFRINTYQCIAVVLTQELPVQPHPLVTFSQHIRELLQIRQQSADAAAVVVIAISAAALQRSVRG
jgi:hypothetical protein